jgi:hypothetical protein
VLSNWTARALIKKRRQNELAEKTFPWAHRVPIPSSVEPLSMSYLHRITVLKGRCWYMSKGIRWYMKSLESWGFGI